MCNNKLQSLNSLQAQPLEIGKCNNGNPLKPATALKSHFSVCMSRASTPRLETKIKLKSILERRCRQKTIRYRFFFTFSNGNC